MHMDHMTSQAKRFRMSGRQRPCDSGGNAP